MNENDSDKIRLSKLMAQRGLCSRREADELIAHGKVIVDGLVINQLGSKVSPNCKIELAAQARKELARAVTIILNKPVGYVSHLAEKGYRDARELLTPENQSALDKNLLDPRPLENLAVAGRLDIESQGLLVFTQNGVIARQLIGEDSVVEKEYLVRVRGSLSPQNLEKLRFGLELDGQPLKRAEVDWLNQDQLRFVLRQGKKRQIRRMCEAVGLTVLGLKRVRVGRLMLGNLSEGQWRSLRPDETF